MWKETEDCTQSKIFVELDWQQSYYFFVEFQLSVNSLSLWTGPELSSSDIQHLDSKQFTVVQSCQYCNWFSFQEIGWINIPGRARQVWLWVVSRRENGILVNISQDKLANTLPSLLERKIRKRAANSCSLKVTVINILESGRETQDEELQWFWF